MHLGKCTRGSQPRPRPSPEQVPTTWHNGCYGFVVSGSDCGARHVCGECVPLAHGALVDVARGRLRHTGGLRLHRRPRRAERGTARHPPHWADGQGLRSRRNWLPRCRRRPVRHLVVLRCHPVVSPRPRRRHTRQHAGGDHRRIHPWDSRSNRRRLGTAHDRARLQPSWSHSHRDPRGLHAPTRRLHYGSRHPLRHHLFPDLKSHPARRHRFLPPQSRAAEHAHRARHLQADRPGALRIPGLARHLGIGRRAGACLSRARSLAPRHHASVRCRRHGTHPRLLRHAHGWNRHRGGRGNRCRRAAPHGRLRSCSHPHRRVDRLWVGRRMAGPAPRVPYARKLRHGLVAILLRAVRAQLAHRTRTRAGRLRRALRRRARRARPHGRGLTPRAVCLRRVPRCLRVAVRVLLR